MNARTFLGLLAVAVSAVPLAATATAEEPAAPAPPDQVVAYYEGGDFAADLKNVLEASDGEFVPINNAEIWVLLVLYVP